MKRVVAARLLLAAFSMVAMASVRADPWLAPGDESLRSDLQLLADDGILKGPVTAWPISWPDVARDVLAADTANLDASTAEALVRVQRLARQESALGYAGSGIRLSGSHEPGRFRAFGSTPREEGEVAMRTSWLGDHLALNLQGTYAVDPDDGQEFRFDGSYIGLNIGNFMISAALMERWWGPGWDGSLILSTNARPIPSLTVERNYSDPFKTKWLSWIGPWRASLAVGEAEGSDVAVPNVRFLAARVTVKPRSWLEVGISRTAQWCGGERECGFKTFTNMLLGRDNQVDDGSTANQPGNQMAGFDLRVRSPWKRLPLAFYSQWIGEDEAGGLPSKFLGQFGLEGWFASPLGSTRLHAEYADTTCLFTRQTPQFNCAYRNEIYPQGYAHRGRIIGHSMDNDSRMYSVGGVLVRPDGDVLTVTVRRVELNRDGAGVHAIAEVPLDLNNVELRYSRVFRFGKVSLGLGYDDDSSSIDTSSAVHGFLSWQQGL